MNNNSSSIENPAIGIDKLIRQFDKILNESGVNQIAHSIAIAKKKNIDSPLEYLVSVMENMSFAKLSERYSEVLELVAEIIANLEEESYFSHLELPSLPELGHENITNLKEFVSYVAMVKIAVQPLIDDEIGSNKKNQLFAAIDNKKKILDKGFFYEFTEGDLHRVQQLINELRQEITASDLFEESHRRRLLRRLEAMQAEMHKKMSDVDRIWGLVGDAGVVIGKFGKDSKPFVDRIKELSQIAWKTQARAEELPSSSQNPLLGHDEE